MRPFARWQQQPQQVLGEFAARPGAERITKLAPPAAKSLMLRVSLLEVWKVLEAQPVAARTEAQKVVFGDVLHQLQPHALRGRLVDAGKPLASCLLSFRDGDVHQHCLTQALDRGFVDVTTAWGNMRLPAAAGPARSTMSGQAVVKITHLPEDRTLVGVVEQVLACAGYKPEEAVVNHEQSGELPSSFKARGLAGCLGVVIAFVTPPPDDPMLSKLPAYFMDSFEGPDDVRVNVAVSYAGMHASAWPRPGRLQEQQRRGPVSPAAEGHNLPQVASPQQPAAPLRTVVQAPAKGRRKRTRVERRTAPARAPAPAAPPAQPAAWRTASQAAQMAAKHSLAKEPGEGSAAQAQEALEGGASGEGDAMHAQFVFGAVLPESGVPAPPARADMSGCSQGDGDVAMQPIAAQELLQADAGVAAPQPTPAAAVSDAMQMGPGSDAAGASSDDGSQASDADGSPNDVAGASTQTPSCRQSRRSARANKGQRSVPFYQAGMASAPACRGA